VTKSGPSFSATSNAAKSPSATTAVPAAPPASTNTAACASPAATRPRRAWPPHPDLANLQARIAEAETHRWFGEAEGLKVSLAGARSKLAQMNQISARRNTAANLGIPSFSEVAGRTISTNLTRTHDNQRN
jgi:hypothetical protein